MNTQCRAEARDVMHGRGSMMAILRETGESGGKHLDVLVALVLSLTDGKISQVTGNISDVDQFSDYLL